MKDNKENSHPLDTFVSDRRLHRMESVLSNRTKTLTVVLDRIKNYHNVSAVIRSADAFGINDVHLVGEKFEYTKGISRGSERWIDLIRHETPSLAISNLKKEGYSIVVLQPEEITNKDKNLTALPVFQLPFSEKLALVFGNERLGVDKEFTKNAKYGAYIPMFGFVESFNISVACAITLFCSTTGTSEHKRDLLPLTQEQKAQIKDRWLKDDVNNSEKILEEISSRLEKA